MATEVTWPTAPLTGANLQEGSEFHEFIEYVYGWGVGVGALFTFAMIIYGGFMYMVSSGDPGRVKDAVSRIKSAVLGMIILLSSFIILNTINPQLTRIGPLPPLWDGVMLSGIQFDEDRMQEPPCEVAVLRTEGGSEVELHPGRDYTGAEVERKYVSGKGFRSMTEEERAMREENEIGVEKETFGDLIEGSSCLVTFYHRKGWFGDACGNIAGTVPLPNNDIEKNMSLYESEGNITCLRVQNVGRGGEN